MLYACLKACTHNHKYSTLSRRWAPVTPKININFQIIKTHMLFICDIGVKRNYLLVCVWAVGWWGGAGVCVWGGGGNIM